MSSPLGHHSKHSVEAAAISTFNQSERMSPDLVADSKQSNSGLHPRTFHPSGPSALANTNSQSKGKESAYGIVSKEQINRKANDESDSKKKPRVNDSLLLDNFLISKKKEEPVRQTLHRALLDF